MPTRIIRTAGGIAAPSDGRAVEAECGLTAAHWFVHPTDDADSIGPGFSSHTHLRPIIDTTMRHPWIRRKHIILHARDCSYVADIGKYSQHIFYSFSLPPLKLSLCSKRAWRRSSHRCALVTSHAELHEHLSSTTTCHAMQLRFSHSLKLRLCAHHIPQPSPLQPTSGGEFRPSKSLKEW